MPLTIVDASIKSSEKTILHTVNAQINSGKITAIVGPNGSAKSTLLSLLSGARRPSEGQVLLNDKPLSRWSKKVLAKSLAVLPQSLNRPSGMHVYDLVSCGRFPYTGTWNRFSPSDHQAVIGALDKVDLLDKKNDRVDCLSGGEMQRVWLAMALAQESDILLLDEPTSYLDISHQLSLLNIVRQLNREHAITVVWVLHDLNHAMQFSDDIWVMNEGHLVHQGSPNSLLNTALLSEYFGIDAEFTHSQRLQVPTIIPLSQGSMFALVDKKVG